MSRGATYIGTTFVIGVALLAVLIVIRAKEQRDQAKEQRDQFMESCRQHRVEYECIWLWRTSDRGHDALVIVPVPAVR
jgi:hypothetical protein